MFVNHFHMYLLAKQDEFVIDLDDVYEWIGFTQKHHAKRALVRVLTENESYIITKGNDDDGRGGHNKDVIMMTVRGFKKLCMSSGTEKGQEVREYYIAMEEILLEQTLSQVKSQQILINEQNQELIDVIANRDALEDTLNSLEETMNTKVLYIWQSDARHGASYHVKIGVTDNCCNRIKNFRQSSPYSRFVHQFKIPFEATCTNLEKNIIDFMKPYSIGGECFQCSIDTVTLAMRMFLLTGELIKTHGNDEARLQDLLQAALKAAGVEGINAANLNSCDVAVQTDTDADNSMSLQIITNQEFKETFDKFINERCDVHDAAEAATTAIAGAYRIWCRKPEKEAYHALLKYLRARFFETRLTTQNQDHVINGFRGVSLREVVPTMSAVPSDVETFLFQECGFVPDGKATISDVVTEYQRWRHRLGKPVRDQQCDRKDVTDFLKDYPLVVQTVIWAETGGKKCGQGYYGLQIKNQVPRPARAASATAKAVYKKDKITHEVLNSWSTIAKAADAEGLAPAKMSRILKKIDETGVVNIAEVDGLSHYYTTAVART